MISIVVPVYKNQDTLRLLAERLSLALDGEDYELIMINDGSPDASLEALRDLAGEDHRVKVISLSRNFGQQSATNAGLSRARGDELVIMDADLQDRPEDVPMLLARLRDDSRPVEIVYTVKTVRHDTMFTRLTSKLFHNAYGRLAAVPVPYGVGTFRAFSRMVKEELLRYGERNILYGPLMFSLGFSHDFLDVVHEERIHGQSSYNFSRRLALALNTLIRYTDIPYRLFLGMGAAIVALSLLYAMFNIFQYMVYGRILMGGLALIILLLLFLIGSVFFVLGLLGIYIFQIFQEVLGRPRYHVELTLNFEPPKIPG
jgi:dolichol-phosphate mannosyltransferase